MHQTASEWSLNVPSEANATWVSLTHTNVFQSLQVLSNNNYYDDADANDDDDDPWG